MPTPDASAFTTQRKYASYSVNATIDNKVLTYSYQLAPLAKNIRNFLPSFTNKSVRPLTLSVQNALSGVKSPMNNGYRQNGLPVKRVQ
jgi:hypothetical protein